MQNHENNASITLVLSVWSSCAGYELLVILATSLLGMKNVLNVDEVTSDCIYICLYTFD